MLERVPYSLQCLAAIYAGMFGAGLVLTREAPQAGAGAGPGLRERLAAAATYLARNTFTCRDFYLLWLTRCRPASPDIRCIFLHEYSGFSSFLSGRDCWPTGRPSA